MKIAKTIETVFFEGLKKLKILVNGKNDVQTSFEVAPFGIDGAPPKGWRAVHANTGIKGKTILLGYFNKGQLESLEEGENRIYSTDTQGDESTFVYLRGDGTMEIGGDADFMVRYSALEAAFNQLKSDFDSHVHSGVIVSVSGGSGAPAVGVPGNSAAPTAGTTADITGAKIDEIKTL